jgi:hypothetical protein
MAIVAADEKDPRAHGGHGHDDDEGDHHGANPA